MIDSIALAIAMVAAPPAPAPAEPIRVMRTAPPVAPPAEPALDPEALAAARELLRSMNFEAQVGKAARQNMDATFNTVMAAQERAAGITFPEDLKQTIHALIQTDTEKLIAEMKPTVLEDTAHVYAKYYTADEIRELQRLQSNPVLAKAQAIAPQFAAELMQIGVRRAADRMPELSRQIKAAVADWFAKHKSDAPRQS